MKPEVKIKVRLKSHGAAFLSKVQAEERRNLELAGMELAREIRDVTLSVSAGGASKRAKAIRREPSHKEYEKYRHSLPGEPPRNITGFGRRNVTHRMVPNKLAVQVGIFKNAIYMAYLEFGVRRAGGGWKIAPRPWLLSTFKKIRPRLAKIAAGGGK